MGEFASAGTMVNALLQTAGFITQAEILGSFRTFFESGGALVYTMGAIAGIVSIVLFGGYEKGRYFLIGPALYYFLVGPTAETQGAIWRLGDSDPRTVSGPVASVAEAIEYVQNTVYQTRESGDSSGWSPGEPIRVAWFFKWFTDLIDYFVRESSRVILAHENDQDLLFIARHRALETIVHARVEKPELLAMFEANFAPKCESMLSASIALASPDLRREHMLWLKKNGYSEQAKSAKAVKEFYEARYNAAKREEIQPNAATLDFMRRNESSYDSVKNAIAGFKERRPGLDAGARLADLEHDLSVTCGDLWLMTKDAFLEHAHWFYEKLIETHAGDFRELSDAERHLKSALARKLAGADVQIKDDDIIRGIGFFLIKNALEQRAMARVQQHHLNWKSSIDSVPEGSILIFDNGPKKTRILRKGVDDFRIVLSKSGEWLAEINGGEGRELHRFTPLAPVGDHQDIAFTDSLRYQTRGMRQGIFTYAMNLPYYQGVGLYLLSIAYPFCALVVLIPSRAQSFLFLPLCWLWLKSWDIGFACVRVFEKVLWGMLPHSDLAFDAFERELPDVFHEALKADPLYNLYSYYYLLSTALMAIPAVTAYATIKARSSVLSVFTDAPKQAASDAANRGEGAWGVQMMNKRKQAMDALAGIAQYRHVADGDMERSTLSMLKQFGMDAGIGAAAGFGASLSGRAARDAVAGSDGSNSGKGAGGGNEAGKAQVGKWKAFGSAARNPVRLLKSLGAGLGSAGDLVAARVAQRSVYDRYFDPEIGRASPIQFMYGAAMAAMDSEGGFEVEGSEFFPAIDAQLDYETALLGFGVEKSEQMLGGIVQGAGARYKKKMDEKRDAERAGQSQEPHSPIGEPSNVGRYVSYVPAVQGVLSWLLSSAPGELKSAKKLRDQSARGEDGKEWNRETVKELVEKLDVKLDTIQPTYPRYPSTAEVLQLSPEDQERVENSE